MGATLSTGSLLRRPLRARPGPLPFAGPLSPRDGKRASRYGKTVRVYSTVKVVPKEGAGQINCSNTKITDERNVPLMMSDLAKQPLELGFFLRETKISDKGDRRRSPKVRVEEETWKTR